MQRKNEAEMYGEILGRKDAEIAELKALLVKCRKILKRAPFELFAAMDKALS